MARILRVSMNDQIDALGITSESQPMAVGIMGHVLMENRNGLAVDATLTHATGTAEREATLVMLDRRKGKHRITLGADKAYDVTGFIGDLRMRKVTPHIAVSKTGKKRKTAMDGRTLRHAGYEISQRIRKRIEEVFGWVKKARRSGKGEGPQQAQGRGCLHLHHHRLQSDQAAQTDQRNPSMIDVLTGLTIISTSDGGKSVAKTLKSAQKREKMKLVATSSAAC